MTPQAKLSLTQRTSSALLQFVQEHYRQTYANDDGALLGHLAKLAEEGPGPLRIDQRSWHQAVSKAVSAH